MRAAIDHVMNPRTITPATQLDEPWQGDLPRDTEGLKTVVELSYDVPDCGDGLGMFPGAWRHAAISGWAAGEPLPRTDGTAASSAAWQIAVAFRKNVAATGDEARLKRAARLEMIRQLADERHWKNPSEHWLGCENPAAFVHCCRLAATRMMRRLDDDEFVPCAVTRDANRRPALADGQWDVVHWYA